MIRIKTAPELEKMKRACEISAGALAVAGRMICPGVTGAEVDKAVEKYIVSQGARPNFKGYGGFPASVCISVNDVVIHGIPSKKMVFREGDIVSVDTGAVIDGFHGDNAYTYACGTVSADAKKLLCATRESLFRGIAAAAPGKRIGDVGHAIQDYVESFGFSAVRDFVGHGIGSEMHEPPDVPNYGKSGHGVRLMAGMTLAIEPMINQFAYAVHVEPDGWAVKTNDSGLSAHFEHTVAITKDGPLILTEWQVDPWKQ